MSRPALPREHGTLRGWHQHRYRREAACGACAAVRRAARQGQQYRQRNVADGRAYAYASDRDYLTVAEFAALSSGEQIAVWQAHAEGRVQAVAPGSGSTRRYRRDQVEALLRGTEAPRG